MKMWKIKVWDDCGAYYASIVPGSLIESALGAMLAEIGRNHKQFKSAEIVEAQP